MVVTKPRGTTMPEASGLEMPEATGLLVPPMTVAPLAAALQRLAADPALRARMGAAGRSRALDRFDEAKVVGRTLDLLGL
jgi:glycosyltransferase involved in cell wall biosynthesis